MGEIAGQMPFFVNKWACGFYGLGCGCSYIGFVFYEMRCSEKLRRI